MSENRQFDHLLIVKNKLMSVFHEFMINNMTDAWKTDLNLLIGQTLLFDK